MSAGFYINILELLFKVSTYVILLCAIVQLIYCIIQWIDDVECHKYLFENLLVKYFRINDVCEYYILSFWIWVCAIMYAALWPISTSVVIIYLIMTLLRKLRRAQKILKVDLDKPVPPQKRE